MRATGDHACLLLIPKAELARSLLKTALDSREELENKTVAVRCLISSGRLRYANIDLNRLATPEPG